MHNNYYFLRQLSSGLESILNGYSVVSCFSQHKEELIIEFNNTKDSFFIRADLNSGFSCLSFPDSFNRARKNSIDLFPDVILKKVTGTKQFENERCFSILLEENLQLLFKMHGNRSNIILIKNRGVKEVFKNNLADDFNIDITRLDRQIDWSKEAFLKNIQNLSQLYFTFGKEVWKYLESTGFNKESSEEKWQSIQKLLQLLNHPLYHIIEEQGKPVFSLLPYGHIEKEFSSPIEAINDFFNRVVSETAFHSEKTLLLKQLRDQLSASKSYLFKNSQKLLELENDQHYQQWADLIMANLHRIKVGEEKVMVEDFYNENKSIEIKIKKELSAQKNAEVFYRKGKNQQIEIQKLKEAITKKEKEIDKTEKTINEAEAIGDIKQLRKKSEVSSPRSKNEIALLPYHEFEFKGYKIWVGRNAESNDKLTLKYSFKEDLWLHVKDVPGSHVIIKYQSGKNFPKDVIERAAELAAYNSKRKTESLCAVIFTPKKYVRKRKGDPAGAMVVEREEVILVEPRLEIRS